MRYTFNGTIADKSYPLRSPGEGAQPFQQSATLRENRSSKNLVSGGTGTGIPAQLARQHKRSMTLKTRNTLKEQVGETFQSIKEEPAEDNAKSIENKTNDDRSAAGGADYSE